MCWQNILSFEVNQISRSYIDYYYNKINIYYLIANLFKYVITDIHNYRKSKLMYIHVFCTCFMLLSLLPPNSYYSKSITILTKHTFTLITP